MESTDEVGAAEEVASKVEAEEDDEEEEEEEEGAEEDMLACPSEKWWIGFWLRPSVGKEEQKTSVLQACQGYESWMKIGK